MVKSMPQSGRIQIRLLGESDIPAAMQLKELAGWNQTEGDWRRLLQLEPSGCFGAFLDGSLVGTTTTTTYDRELAWIGMVLVSPENRRCGIATQLIKTALDYLSTKVMTVKLDATPEGQPVYERLGFKVESLIERYAGVAPARSAYSNNVVGDSNLDPEAFREMVELDRFVFGADRSPLIKSLIDNACVAPVFQRDAEGRLSGYALARRGTSADYLGPIVVTEAERAEPLLDRLLKQLPDQKIYVDLNTSFKIGERLLADRGFRKQRNLVRMSRGTKSKPISPFVFAIAGPEIG
ncbi:MAG TPA: GNAT family N-acetyltransferase [Pyrinomonadaceae bacterium]|nr:GNAT family N-acetyltransferase [Pyrinomonadaceae bacterium]